MNDDCMSCIFCELEISDIVNCLLVCKQFNRVAKSEMLWYLLFKEKFYNVKYVITNKKKFYNNFKKYSILNKFLLKNNQGNVNIITKKLYLDSKLLQSVPKELSQLSMLQELYLHNNQLQTIPKELGQLATLQELYLHNNQLQSIPKEFSQLVMLRTFHLDRNLENLISLDNGTDIIYT